jgi:hypothetical protein
MVPASCALAFGCDESYWIAVISEFAAGDRVYLLLVRRRVSGWLKDSMPGEHAPVPGRIPGGKVSLFADVPHIQEGAVAGGRNLASSFPGCAVQRGTNFFL